MSTLYPDRAPQPPEPHEPQSEELSPEPFHAPSPEEPSPQFRPRPEFELRPAPDRLTPFDSRTPFHWMDLVYLIIFYFVCGGLLTLIVAAGAFVFFGISPSELKSSTTAWASVMIISQALLSGATLAFLYAILRGRTSAPFWQSLGWRDFHKMATHASIALRYIVGGFGLAVLVGWAGQTGKQSRRIAHGGTVPQPPKRSDAHGARHSRCSGRPWRPFFGGCIYP